MPLVDWIGALTEESAAFTPASVRIEGSDDGAVAKTNDGNMCPLGGGRRYGGRRLVVEVAVG